jgi:hypothetical protein
MQTLETSLNTLPAKRRRDLIPVWMKPFIFLFMLFGITSLYGIWRNIIGNDSETSIYGLEAFTIFSAMGIFLKSIMFFKAITAFGLWMEKDWAIKFGIIDAVFGLIVCIMVMVVLPFVEIVEGVNRVNFRFEVLLLIPYLIQLIRMRKAWDDPEASVPALFPKKSSPIVTTMPATPVPTPAPTVVQPTKEETIDKEDHSRFMPK